MTGMRGSCLNEGRLFLDGGAVQCSVRSELGRRMNGSRGDSVRSWFDTLTTNGNGVSGTSNLDCFFTGLPRFARNDGGVNDGVFAVLERVPRILGGLPCTAPFVLRLVEG